MNTTRIIVLAKAPRPGTVKTRLISALGPEGAAQLARRMLESTLRVALSARLGPVELCMSPDLGAAAWEDVALPGNIELSTQGGGDLGARLARAAQRALGQQQRVILLGTDCPDMSVSLLREADSALRETGAVIYCTADGGYALLGLSRYSDLLFHDMPWGGARVAGETVRRFVALDWPLHVGRILHDIDVPDDLSLLPVDWLPAAASHSLLTETPDE